MANDNKSFSQLTLAPELNSSSLVPITFVDTTTNPPTYSSYKTTFSNIATLLLNDINYTTELDTIAKTIIGAINELEAGGGGGGSSVSWSQLIGTGTKIATITINGVATDVYAPTSGGASYTDVTGTLAAGSTTITLSDQAILTTSTIDIYTDVFGVNPTGMTVNNGSVVLTFPAQQSAVNVKVRVS